MPKRGSKGRFVKSATRSRASYPRSSGTTAIVVAAPRSMSTRRRAAPKKRRRSGGGRRRHAAGGGIKPLHVLAGGLALGYLTGSHGPAFIKTAVAKVPGNATFGAAGVIGVGALAFNHFKPNKYAKLIGLIGLGVAAVGVGSKGTDFKWVGDDEGGGDDIADVDISDVGDEDDEDVGYDDGYDD